MIKFEKTVAEIAELIGGEIVGSTESVVNYVNRIEEAKSGDLTFYNNHRYKKYFDESEATCFIVSPNIKFDPKPDKSYIVVDNPQQAVSQILQFVQAMYPKQEYGVHPTAIIDPSVQLPKNVYIGAYVVIEKNCKIGENVVIKHNCSIYENTTIGDNTLIHANVVLYSYTEVGKNCVIHSGAVIGSDGFGYTESKEGEYTKIPQLGNAVLEDYVEIGSNTTVDRSLLGSTIIGKGTKIDNLCMIAHNVTVGENSAMASQVGISGSTKIGKRNRLGGQVGFAGHCITADDVIVLAQAGVPGSIEKKGMYIGSPAKERLEMFKIYAAMNNLPQLMKDFYDLKRKMDNQ